MVENPDIATPVIVPEGSAMAHARGFSSLMGGFSGAVAGGILGAVWGMAGRSSVLIRASALAAIGAVTGFALSSRTWNTPPRIQPPGPIAEPDFAHDNTAEQQAANDHITRLMAERNAPQADIAQAL